MAKVDLLVATSGGTSYLTGTVTVTAEPRPAVQTNYVEFFIDSVRVSTDSASPFSYSWDTTTVADGWHEVMAKAYFPRNQVVEKKLNVTVQNVIAPPPPPPIQDPPVNVTLPTIVGTPTEGQRLTCLPGTWTNEPTSYSYQWVRCDAAGANGVAIIGATGSTYVLVTEDVTKTIRCAVTAFNAVGNSAVATSAQTDVIAALTPAVPANTSLPIISGTLTRGSSLSCSTGAWTNTPTSYAYQWQRCDSAGANCVNIASATASTYVLTTADVGQTIRCGVIASNGSGAGTVAYSATTSAIADPPPPPTGTLRYRPPGYDGSGSPSDPANYPGYELRTATSGAETLNLSNSVDYFIRLGAKSIGSGKALVINGGRNVVIVGGSILTGHGDDFGIQIDGGTSGTVHIEGVIINTTNAITLRSPRALQIVNCHFTCTSTTGAHSDVIQVWMNGGQSAGIRVHRLTCYSNFSFLSDFTDEPTQDPFGSETPAFWELYDIDMHSTYIGNWMGYPPTALWRGSNCWLETSTESSGNRRRLGDQLRQYGLQYTPLSAAFQYFDANNNLVFTSAPDPANGYAPGDYGRRQGDRMRYQAGYHPLLAGMEWRCQKPTTADGADANGNFVTPSTVGVGYVSPGYK